MKTLRLILSLCLAMLPMAAFATPVVYYVDAINTSGTYVSGCSISLGTQALTMNVAPVSSPTATSVPTTAGEYTVSSSGIVAIPSAAISVTATDLGNGEYAISYDTSTQGEINATITFTKASNTFSPASIPIRFTTDPNSIAQTLTITGTINTNVNTANTNISATQTQTTAANQQANNAASLTAYGAATATNVSAVPANVWAVGTRTITGGALTTAPPTTAQIAAAILANPSYLLLTNSSGYTTATNGGGTGTVSGYAAGEDPATLVLGALASSWDTANTIGYKLNNISGGGSDPWATSLPGSYTSGQAGYIIGNYLTSAIATDIPNIYTQTSASNQQTNSAIGVLGATTSSYNAAGSIGSVMNGMVTTNADVVTINTNVAALPSAATVASSVITAMKSDSQLRIALLNHNLNKITYNPTSGVLTVLGDDNTTIGTVTVTTVNNVITSRE